MLTGLVLILLGVLIYIQPRIAIALLSGFLIVMGIGLMIFSWRLRRLSKVFGQTTNRWTRFIIRF